MVKQGPCHHCGVTSTPLWRNGPPEKPVLCNACGSRWRTKGTLTNYTPLHARGELLDSGCAEIPRTMSIPIKKDLKLHKRTYDVIVEVEGEASNADQNFQKLEEDSSNRSSSGSAVSYSESCAHFGAAKANEMIGGLNIFYETVGAQSNVWSSLVPSRKRTCIGRPKQSPVEKLTKELQSILDEQQHLSLESASSEENLLLESGTLMDSLERGHGGCLLKYSKLKSGAQESEASSFSVDNKYQSASDAYSAVSSLSASDRNEMTGFPSIENVKANKLTVLASQENRKRDKNSPDELMAIVNDTSLLPTVDLRDVFNHEVFMNHLTSEEQEWLMKDLPSLEGAKPPDSLKEIFVSPQFLESVSSFQQLLLKRISGSSSSRMSNEEFRALEVPSNSHSPKQSCWTSIHGNADFAGS